MPTISFPLTRLPADVPPRQDEFVYVIDDLVHRIDYVTSGTFENPRKAKLLLERYVAADVLSFGDVAAIPATRVELLYTQACRGITPIWQDMADELRLRWSSAEVKPIRVYFASPKTIRRLGGDMPGRLKQLDAISHDLGLASVFLKLTRSCPLLRRAWISEARIPQAYGIVHPDALIADSSGPRILIEFCGCYTAERLVKLSKYAELQSLPIQFWTIAREVSHE